MSWASRATSSRDRFYQSYCGDARWRIDVCRPSAGLRAYPVFLIYWDAVGVACFRSGQSTAGISARGGAGTHAKVPSADEDHTLYHYFAVTTGKAAATVSPLRLCL